MIDRDAPFYVAGHRGMVGGAVLRALQARGHARIVTATRQEADLTDRAAVEALFARARPAYVVLAAAKVGGILANDRFGADFIRENLLIQTNVIDAAWRHGTRRLAFLGSSCIYPREAAQPIREEALMTGPLEATNRPYAVAKIAGAAMCDAYRKQHGFDAFTVMPCNVYGVGDNFDPEFEPCHRRADAPLPRGEARGRARGRRLGDRQPACGSSSTPTTSPTPSCS